MQVKDLKELLKNANDAAYVGVEVCSMTNSFISTFHVALKESSDKKFLLQILHKPKTKTKR